MRDEEKTKAQLINDLAELRQRVVTLEISEAERSQALEAALTELQKTQQQIIQQERLRALGEMASGISHEFNNALSPILGYSEMLSHSLGRREDDEKVLRYARTINTAAKDAKQVVRRLREFYRPRDQNETSLPIRLNQLVDVAVSLTKPRWRDMSRAAGRPIIIETDTQPVPPVAGNEVELREVLINIIFNAVEAMPHGGTITIGIYSEGDFAILEISDTGIGMTPEVYQRCMEPFFTTKGVHGNGLGLSVVHGIIRRHGGRITIASRHGEGTTFRVFIPFWKKSPGEESKSHFSFKLTHKLHILVVEDEPSVRQVLTEYLVSDGHTVETAENGRDGFEKFSSGYFDLVLTDLSIPELNGNQLASAIKQMAPDKPVIMLTGFDYLTDTPTKKSKSVDLLLSKPVEIKAFRQALAKVMKETEIRG